MQHAHAHLRAWIAIAVASASLPAAAQFLDERTTVARHSESASSTSRAQAGAFGSQRLWQVRAADRTVVDMLRRWAAASGWKVVVKSPPSIPISGDDEFDRPDFLQAADYVIAQARKAGYGLRATAYENNVLELDSE